MARVKPCADHEINEPDCPECEGLRILADPAPTPTIPHMGMDDDEVENTDFGYSTRGPDDWVSSGPLGEGGHGRGRAFDTWVDAEAWARDFYGQRFKGKKPDEPNSGGRWAFIIKGPRGAT